MGPFIGPHKNKPLEPVQTGDSGVSGPETPVRAGDSGQAPGFFRTGHQRRTTGWIIGADRRFRSEGSETPARPETPDILR